MARTPKRLSGPSLVANVVTTKYTVPAVTKTIVRHIHVSNPGLPVVNFTLTIGADAAGTRIFDVILIPGRSVLDHFAYYILEAGEIIQSNSGTNNALVLIIDGDEITLG